MKYIIGNWKSNKSFSEVRIWADAFKAENLSLLQNATIIICTPYPFISYMHECFKDYDFIHIGSQDISFYGSGAYTGEVSGHCLQDIATYCIIGHSERRNYFKETNATVDQKVRNALGAKITPIVCVRDERDVIPDDVQLVTYEPVEAIGTGKNESVENVLAMKKKLFLKEHHAFLYGGSVDPENAGEYLQNKNIDGMLIGKASLDPHRFFAIAAHSTE